MMAYQLSVLVHLLAGACWIGVCSSFPRPFARLKGHPERRRLLLSTGLKFPDGRFSGAGNIVHLGPDQYAFPWNTFSWISSQTNYGNLVLWKTVLFLLLIGLNLVHDLAYGRKATVRESAVENPRLVRLTRWSGRLTLLISSMAWLGVIISRGG